MAPFRTMIVDDEPLARELVAELLAPDPEIEVVATCGDGKEALRLVRESSPDILFLDVEMPKPGGLEVAAALGPDEMPAIVFVTAYGHYAIPAFQVEAIDYVLKPFSNDRFLGALERAKRRVRERRLGELAKSVVALTSELEQSGGARRAAAGVEPEPYLEALKLTVGARTVLLPVEEIDWIESDDYYVRVHSGRGQHLLRVSLTRLEKRLDPRRFGRLHRGAIVNLDRVSAVERLPNNLRQAVLVDGTRLRISRSRRRAFEARWQGGAT